MCLTPPVRTGELFDLLRDGRPWTRAQLAEATGLAVGTPVAVGAVDALSEAISVGVVRPGDLMIMYGSTTFFILVQSQPTPAGISH